MGTLETQSPLELDAVEADVQGGFDELDALPGRVIRYGKARALALETLAYIVGGLNPDNYTFTQSALLCSVAEKLEACANWLHFRQYPTAGKARLHAAFFCREHLLCAFCAIRRGAKALAAYVKRYEVLKVKNPAIKNSMITFTIANGPDLLERFDHVQNAIRELNKRRVRAKTGDNVTEWSKALGWVGSYEIKRGANSQEWHIHAHVIVLHTEWIDIAALKAEWKRITGDSHVINIAPARHPNEPARDFVEVFKYAVKFGEMSLNDRLEAFLKLPLRRLIFSGGSFRGVVVPKSLADESLDDLPFVDLFYVYGDQSGYSLEAVRPYQGETVYVHPDTRVAKLAAVMIRDGDLKTAAIQNRPEVACKQAKAAVDFAGHIASSQRPDGWTDRQWLDYLAEYKKRLKWRKHEQAGALLEPPSASLASLAKVAAQGNAGMGVIDDG